MSRPVTGAEREAVVRVAEGEPEVRVARRRADDRQHVRRAGTRAHPGLGVEPLGEREQVARDRLRAAELHRRADGVAQRELRAGGEADAAPHRRQDVAALGVEHRDGSSVAVAGRAVVHVVAALHRERQVVAERARHHVRPGPERDDDVAAPRRCPSTVLNGQPAVRREARSVALQKPPAPALEQLQVGEREALRIDHAAPGRSSAARPTSTGARWGSSVLQFRRGRARDS